MAASSPVVCVTGAAGYIASHIVKELLSAGFRTRGTVRSLKDPEKIGHLTTLAKSFDSQLELYEADLLKQGSFAAAFKGCDYVIHAASPFQMTVGDPQTDLIDPAVSGTRNVVEEAVRTGTVKRTVVTSSVAAIRGNKLADYVYTEADWNEVANLSSPYPYSKVLAERAAWEVLGVEPNGPAQSAGAGMDMVTVCPVFVLGPPLSARVDGESCRIVQRIMDGTYLSGTVPIPAFNAAPVDVRDVAKLHVAALTTPEASNQRILATAEPATQSVQEYAAILRCLFPTYPVPTDATPPPSRLLFDNAKSRRVFGITYRSIEETLSDMVTAMLDLGAIPRP